MIEVIAVVGPTASGKTDLAIQLAERLRTEIISADSMQVYKGMEIGTGAPTPEQRSRIKHHFVGTLPMGSTWSAGAFELAARPIVRKLNAQGKPAIVAGGSGLYVQALIDGIIDVPPSDPVLRKRIENEAEISGGESLYRRLQGLDPEYADVIHCHDLRRIIRALEVYEATGTPLGQWHRIKRDGMRPLHSIQFGIQYLRHVLYQRINARVDSMLQSGFLDELNALMSEGHASHLERLRTLGYKEFIAFLRGECTREAALEAMKQNTRRYAKRQLTWFRADDRIRWIEGDGAANPAQVALASLGGMHNETD